jgi:hypothetical protein
MTELEAIASGVTDEGMMERELAAQDFVRENDQERHELTMDRERERDEHAWALSQPYTRRAKAIDFALVLYLRMTPFRDAEDLDEMFEILRDYADRFEGLFGPR